MISTDLYTNMAYRNYENTITNLMSAPWSINSGLILSQYTFQE